MFASVSELDQALCESGYIADPVTVTTVFLAAALHRPLLLEGPAGSGKTQLAYAVAEAAHTRVERLQCYQGINEEKAIGRFDESLQRLSVQFQAHLGAIDWAELAVALQGRCFFTAGPLLLALEYDKPCVLLIDELDKVDAAFEAQALKRAAACFGLGEYLYYIPGFWVDVDKDEVPLTVPTLPEWATPEGWLRGARPGPERIRDAAGGVPEGFDLNIICQIEKMHANLGTQVYRRILKGYRVWEPTQIPDPETAAKVLSEMEAVEKQLHRAAHAFDRVGRTAGEEILRSFALKSISDFGDLLTLKKVVSALEEISALDSTS